MDEKSNLHPKMLAEILRLQRWAGGDSVSADRIFGLLHGFESTLEQESESDGISKSTQRKIEDLLEDVEHGKQSSDGMSIKDRLHRDGVDESDASRVMELCRLQSRFTEGIEQIVQSQGSVFRYLHDSRLPEHDWFGALHYMELVDVTHGGRNKMYAVFAPTVPRIGEVVTPQSGSRMKVVEVEHVVIAQGAQEGVLQHYLAPHVLLEAVEEQEDEDL